MGTQIFSFVFCYKSNNLTLDAEKQPTIKRRLNYFWVNDQSFMYSYCHATRNKLASCMNLI